MSAKDDHLTHDLLLQFLTGQIPAQRFVERCYRHLRATCSVCREEFTMAWVAQRSRGGFDLLVKSILGRTLVLSGEMEAVRDVAEEEFTVLMELPHHERRMAIAQTTGRLRNPFLVSRFLDECRRLLPNDPHQAFSLAELGLDVAVRVDYRAYGSAFTYDLVAQALAHKGNALRVAGDLARASEALEAALQVFEQEKADDYLTRAEVYSFLASLRRDQRRFNEAEDLLGRAISIYREIEQSVGVARTLIKASSVAQERGDLPLALGRIREALGLLDPAAAPRLYYYARFNEALYLTDAGCPEEARDLLSLHRAGIEAIPERCVDIRLLWLTARVAHGLGEYQAAELGYSEARSRYVEEGLPYDAAVTALDLAVLHAERGKWEEIKVLASEMVPVFRDRQIHRDAFAALMLFHDAVHAQKATVEMIRGLISHLRFMQRDRSGGGKG